MRTIAFIPIKLNNERTPGKNIKPFSDGTPLMHFTQRNLIKLKNEGWIDKIYCFCSDESIKSYLLDGVDFLRRSTGLDKKTTKGREIYQSFVDTIDADIYVLSHVTTPFVKIDHIRTCIETVKSGKYDSAFCGLKHQSFFWQDGNPMNFDLSNPPRTQDMTPIYTEVPNPYVFTRETFLKYHSRTGVNPFICEVSELESVDIDYPEDFQMADLIYTHILKGECN